MTGASRGGPTVLRILLGSELRRLRAATGLTPEDAARVVRGSQSKISRMERGRHAFKEIDVADLLTLYGVTDVDERRQLLSLARRANQPGWWQSYSDVLPDWFQPYVGLEEAAELIRTYEAQFVPGLLQTENYAAAVIGLERFPPEEVERRVVLRLARQRRFRDGDLRLWVVLDEAALRRPIGGVAVLREQLERLLAAARRPNLALQVRTFAAGGDNVPGGFSVLRFPDPQLPDAVYVEQLTSALYLDKRCDVEDYTAALDRLSVLSASPDESVEIIKAILDT